MEHPYRGITRPCRPVRFHQKSISSGRCPAGVFCLTLLMGSLLLSGCSLWKSQSEATREEVHPELLQTREASPSPQKNAGVRYSVTFDSSGSTGLLSELKENSQLLWLRDTLPENRVALQRRLLEDLETARKVLHSNGYYDGTVHRSINWETTPVQVSITLEPGPQYVIGNTRILYAAVPQVSSRYLGKKHKGNGGKDFMREAPESLDAFGLKKGEPAHAEAVLHAVDALVTAMHQQGYPGAATVKTQYIIDRSTHTLEATIRIRPGRLLRMGTVRIHENRTAPSEDESRNSKESPEPAVSEAYLNSLIPWQVGQFWDDRLLTSYRAVLQETGLFSSIDMEPDMAFVDRRGDTPVSLNVRNAPPRTISSGMQYATDRGFGVSGAWENRNLFGGGERMRTVMSISQDIQTLTASFRKPSFGHKDQTLVAEAEARNENADAYDQTAAYGAIGLERRFSGDWRHWWASARVSVEGGSISDNNGRQAYALLGFPLGVRRDTTNDLLNPTEGSRIGLTVTPYNGTYHGLLSTVRTRLDMSAYSAPFSTPRIVLAARAGVGSLTGNSVDSIPASLRFYAGGGGSVRGYKYQSLGQHDKDGNPIGGLSFTDVGFETRFRVTESFGIVPFVDGGMVYDSTMPKFGKDMAWGAGLGFRYYTIIGPLRLDIATPLQDRDNNKAFYIYLSIGQSF